MITKRIPKRLKYSAYPLTKEDGLLYVKADPSKVGSWKLEPVVELEKQGGVRVITMETLHRTKKLLTFSIGFPRDDGQGRKVMLTFFELLNIASLDIKE